MDRFSIKWYLARRHLLYLALLPIPLIVIGVGLVEGTPRVLFKHPEDWPFLVLLLVAGLGFVGMLGFSIWRLARIDRHPDLVALARYGELKELLAQIENELADPSVVRFGEKKSFRLAGREFGEAEVWITASWLIYVGAALRMQFFRLDSLVFVYPEKNRVILADFHGVRLEIAGTDAGRARLLAEIMVRVPWALDHFDPATEKTWQENRQEVIAQVAQRRQTVQRQQPAPRKDPSTEIR